jgi:hypothetical protein
MTEDVLCLEWSLDILGRGGVVGVKETRVWDVDVDVELEVETGGETRTDGVAEVADDEVGVEASINVILE